MSNKKKFCQNCGRHIEKGERFCRNCGYNLGIAEHPQSLKSGKQRSSKPLVIAVSSVVLAASLEITGFWYPGFMRNIFTDGGAADDPVTMIKAKETSAEIFADTNGKGTKVGSITENGFSFYIEDGAFSQDGTLTITPADEKMLSRIKDESAYELLATPVEISCDAYAGGFFANDVIFTVPIPKGTDDLGRYVFGYFDEKTGEVRYLEPDSFDTKKGTMSVALPHFFVGLWCKTD